MTKYIDRYYLNGELHGIKFAGGGGGWQPGANTIAYWKLDGDTTDELGNYDMVTRTGTISYGTLSGGQKYGIFNGSTILSVASVPSWTKGTLSFWVNKSGTSEYAIFAQNVNSNDSDAYVNTLLKSSQITFWSAQYNHHNNWSYTQSTGVWHHIVLTQDGSSMSLYVDGTQIGSTWSNSSWFHVNGGNQLCIGGLARGTQTYSILNGYLSNMIIESEARTATEIQDYFNQTKSLYGIS